MSKVLPGAPAKCPSGFRTTIRLMGGSYFKIKYYRSIKRGKESLDAYLDSNMREIWVATYKCTPDHIADSILHEVQHWNLAYARKEHEKEFLPKEMEEAVVCVTEAGNATLFRSNDWFTKLYLDMKGEKK